MHYSSMQVHSVKIDLEFLKHGMYVYVKDIHNMIMIDDGHIIKVNSASLLNFLSSSP